MKISLGIIKLNL